MIKLYPHQQESLNLTHDKNKVAYYLDMGLGKTFVGSEKMKLLNSQINLLICQKSKIDDWFHHFVEYYGLEYRVLNITNKKEFELFMCGVEEVNKGVNPYHYVAIINYEMAFRRPYLLKLNNLTLMLDESSLIQNEKVKRSKFILKMKPDNVILLSGTPTSGKYEKLWSQVQLLGWKISKELFWQHYVDVEWIEDGDSGFKRKHVIGYKNVDRLIKKLSDYGAVFMKSEEVFNLPQQVEQKILISTTKAYRKFMRNSIITITLSGSEFHDDSDFYGKDVTPRIELIGDLTLTKRLYARQLCGQYNNDKLEAFKDLIDSTEDRLIVFYNFNDELDKMIKLIEDRPFSLVNGDVKDLVAYEQYSNSITFVQYQAGAKGLNLQKANKTVYFTLTQSCEEWMQSKKRTHRIGQEKTCFYYYLMCRSSVEEDVLKALESGRDYTDDLFEKYKGE